MKSIIRVCTDHQEYTYTLGDRCPRCGEPTSNSAPPPFTPEDRYSKYRRRIT